VSVPVMTPETGGQVPDEQRGSWASAANPAAAMSDELIVLASQAQHWHHALLRTSAEVLALTEARARPAGIPAIGTDAVRAQICGLLDGARKTSWLRAGAVGCDRASGGADPVADLLLRRNSGVQVLLGGWWARRPTGSWRDSAAEIRVAGGDAPPANLVADLLITDRQLAMTVLLSRDGQLRSDIVGEPSVIGILRTVWEVLWAHSVPLESAIRLRGLLQDEAKASILELLESGAKDETIARALGVSLRTCRRHIAEVLATADAVSRFQAGSRLARACLLSTRSD
jgi:hypothetical protein